MLGGLACSARAFNACSAARRMRKCMCSPETRVLKEQWVDCAGGTDLQRERIQRLQRGGVHAHVNERAAQRPEG